METPCGFIYHHEHPCNAEDNSSIESNSSAYMALVKITVDMTRSFPVIANRMTGIAIISSLDVLLLCEDRVAVGRLPLDCGLVNKEDATRGMGETRVDLSSAVPTPPPIHSAFTRTSEACSHLDFSAGSGEKHANFAQITTQPGRSR